MRALRPAATPSAAAGVTAGTALPVPGAAGPSAAPVFLGVRGGFVRLVDRLTRSLEDRGVELRPDTAVHDLTWAAPPTGGAAPAVPPTSGSREGMWTIRTGAGPVPADGVVVAVPGPVAGALLRPHHAGLADTLAALRYASVVIVTLRFPEDAVDHALDGTGFLVPAGGRRGEAPLLTACTWMSSKWPELRRPGEVLVRVSAGRYGDDRVETMTDDAVVSRCVSELAPMMGVRGAPAEVVVTRWPGAFPQYEVGHLERVAAVEAAAAGMASVAVAGAALHGVGIPACIGSGRRAARAVLTGLGAIGQGP
jgi:oxygen-dependent protoporphyrinogen oxidase